MSLIKEFNKKPNASQRKTIATQFSDYFNSASKDCEYMIKAVNNELIGRMEVDLYEMVDNVWIPRKSIVIGNRGGVK